MENLKKIFNSNKFKDMKTYTAEKLLNENWVLNKNGDLGWEYIPILQMFEISPQDWEFYLGVPCTVVTIQDGNKQKNIYTPTENFKSLKEYRKKISKQQMAIDLNTPPTLNEPIREIKDFYKTN